MCYSNAQGRLPQLNLEQFGRKTIFLVLQLHPLFNERSLIVLFLKIGPWKGNPSVTCGFILQRASNVESVFISWHHHAYLPLTHLQLCTFVLRLHWAVMIRFVQEQISTGLKRHTVIPSYLLQTRNRTESRELSWCQLYRHCLHHTLPFWTGTLFI